MVYTADEFTGVQERGVWTSPGGRRRGSPETYSACLGGQSHPPRWKCPRLPGTALAAIDDGPPPDWIAAPWRLLINGRWQEAAEAWEEFESPFEQALALADGDEDSQRKALDLLTQLGARPLADRVRAGLREAGVTDLPVRPRTYGNRLTDRQLEVVALVAEGLTNAEIN